MNLKKLEEKDIIFLDQSFSEEERKNFSELLKKKKEKTAAKKIDKQISAKHALLLNAR